MQNGLYPITAYHLLFPTQSSLVVPTKSSISDKLLTSSSSSLSSLISTTTENDLTTPIQSMTDPLFFLGNSANESIINSSGMKSRTGTTSSMPHHERTASLLNDVETSRRDSQSQAMGNHLPLSSAPAADEKECRCIIDIQCKIKTKETGSHMVEYSHDRSCFIRGEHLACSFRL